MKTSNFLKLLCFSTTVFSSLHLFAQTNTFPSTGNAGIGTTSPTSSLYIVNAQLGSTINSTKSWITSSGPSISGNVDNLNIFHNRYRTGTTQDWTTAEIKIQKKVDAENQNFISFRGLDGYGSALVFGWGSTDHMFIRNDGNIGINTTSPGQKFDVNGNIRTTGEAISTLSSGVAQFRAIQGNYGFMLRNDGSGSYFLLTASGDQYGTFNALRPLSFNNSNGDVGIGNNALMVNYATGKIGIGIPDFSKATTAGCKLFVGGGIVTEQVVIKTYANWPDYVFARNYKLTPLKEVEKFINENNHLSDIPSEKEIQDKGLNLAEVVRLQMQKIEELTLYLIEHNKKIEELQKEISQLKSK